MEHLTVFAEPRVAALRVDRLRRKTANGLVTPAPESLGELFPELGELMRDGGGGLLSYPVVQRMYASLTTAFAALCSVSMHLPLPEGEEEEEDEEECDQGASTLRNLHAACAAYCSSRDEAYQRALEEIARAEKEEDHLAVERACSDAITANPTLAEPFLTRAGAALHAGDLSRCIEDIRIYLWWSAREGFKPEQHVTAYWRMAEAFLTELEQRADKEGALLDDSVFHCLIDQADWSLRLAFRHDRSGKLALGGSARHLVRRIEEYRAARRTAAELLDSPLVADAAAAAAAAEGPESAEPLARDYAVPWPMDLCAGMPDNGLFSRLPTVGSSQEHEPLDLLMLDCQGLLDLMATMQALAVRAAAFAQRNAECLHWKHRPKPVHVRMQAATAERLAHMMLCIAIAKQVGTVTCADGENPLSGPAFTMDETPHDRFLCTLLTSVIFCRTLTPGQRAEVDRLLTLLVLASMDEALMKRAFPWLEFDDGRKAVHSADGPPEDVAAEGYDATSGSATRSRVGTATAAAAASTSSTAAAALQGPALGGQGPGGSSLLLFRLQHVWIGWLSTAGGLGTPSPSSKPTARLDEDLVHNTARHRLLGATAASICSALDLDLALGAASSGRSQHRLWALLGHFPAGVPTTPPSTAGTGSAAGDLGAEGTMVADDQALDTVGDVPEEDDPTKRMKPPDPRSRWRGLLQELAGLRPEGWCLNPCVLDPVTWEYDSRALADPFKVYSWMLRGGKNPADGEEVPWYQRPGLFLQAAEPPMPAPGSTEAPAVEVIWELLMGQLKVLSSVFNAFEAAENARARMMLSGLGAVPADAAAAKPSKEPPHTARQMGRDTTMRPIVGGRSGDHSVRNRNYQGGPLHVVISSDLRRRVAEEDAEANKEYALGADIERELEGLKRERHQLSLDLELRDYVTLTAVRKKEEDWWGKGKENTVAYKEAMAAGATATWNPAPVACAPVRLRLAVFAGSPWQAAKAASYKGLTFDAVDSRSLLCSGVGLLGMCTWFDSLLKATPHAYIQTRQCEELFMDHLDALAAADASAVVVTDTLGETSLSIPRGGARGHFPSVLPVVDPHRRWPLGPPPPREAAALVAPGTRWPHTPRTRPDERWAPTPRQAPRRAVLTASGVVRWAPPPPPPATGGPVPPTTSPGGPAARRRPPSLSPLDSSKPTAGKRLVKQLPPTSDGEPAQLLFQAPACVNCGGFFEGDERCCGNCGRPRPVDETSDALVGRLRPGPAVPPPGSPLSSKRAGGGQPAQSSPKTRQPHQYTSESSLFQVLMEESLSTRVTPSQMQYLLGVAVRAEPLCGELGLDCLSTAALPVRHNFLFWDSSHEVGNLVTQNWPCRTDRFNDGALGGTQAVPPRIRGTHAPRPNLDPLAVLGKYWKHPGDKEKAEALGPRLLRIRRLGGHPSLGPPSGARRCSNVAFCARFILPSIAPGAQGGNDPVACQCQGCGYAWYCSAPCQATHHAAHTFECQELRALHAAAHAFEAASVDKNKVFLTALLENILAKQFSMVARREALFCCTALSEDLRRTIVGGANATPLVYAPGDNIASRRSEAVDEDGNPDAPHTPRPTLLFVESRGAAAILTGTRVVSHLLDWNQMLVIPEDRPRWRVQLEAALLEGPRKTDRHNQVVHDRPPTAGVGTAPLFDVKLSHAHSAVGVMRLMSRWVGAGQRAPALREAIDEGLIFCAITGLCQTRHFASRDLTEAAIVAVLGHRMALHVAASQEWRALAPSLAPPKQFQEQGLQGIECAQYTAYYAFLQPLRLPFSQLRPLLPVVCIAWGGRAKRALMSLPHTPVPSRTVGSTVSESLLDGHEMPTPFCATSGGSTAPGGELVTFIEVATRHLANIQLVDTVHLDTVTGMARFVLYTSVVEGRMTGEGLEEAWVLLLDAARGMQAVAQPIPAKELRRCAL